MSLLNKALNLAGIRETVQNLRGEVDTLRSKLEKAMREREELAAAPAARADVVAMLNAYIDRQADAFPARLSDSLALFIRHAQKTATGPTQPMPLLSVPSRLGTSPTPASLEEGIFFAFRDQVKAGIKAAIEAAPWPDNARPLAEREAKLVAMDEEIASLSKELDALASEATAAGISI